MGFTDLCDIFASFHEEGFNHILQHVMKQRPSLFNYATADLIRYGLFCAKIEEDPIIQKRGDPLATIVPALPIPGTILGMDFAVQLTELRLDFHPGNQLDLPPELMPPLHPQMFAIKLKACGGLSCPSDEVLINFIPLPTGTHEGASPAPDGNDGPTDRPPVPLPIGKLLCFCLDAYVVGHMVIKEYSGTPFLEMRLLGFEIVDIQPGNLENEIECYLQTMMKLVVLPKLRVLLERTVLDFKQYLDNLKSSIFVKVKPTHLSAALHHNPAVEDDEVKLFIQVEVT